MKDFVYYNNLYDLYSMLLTDKQQNYFEDYYFSNLSLGEIADNYGVSRNAVYKQLKITIDKLVEYEEKLHLLEKKEKLLKLITCIKDKELKEEFESCI